MQLIHPESNASIAVFGTSLSKGFFERHYKYLRPLQQKLADWQYFELTQFLLAKSAYKKLT